MKGDYKAGEMNKLSSAIVCAGAQSELAEKLLPLLTERESDVFKRARNAKKGARAKHASVSDYNNATGIEAVFGYLYLAGAKERLEYLMNFEDKI